MALKGRRWSRTPRGLGECFEAGEAVRFADAAVADAAEGEIHLVEVNQRMVDDRAARARARRIRRATLRSRLKM